MPSSRTDTPPSPPGPGPGASAAPPSPDVLLAAVLRAGEDRTMVVDGTGRVLPGGAAGLAAGTDAFGDLGPHAAAGRRAALERVMACGVGEWVEDQDAGRWWSVGLTPVTNADDTVGAAVLRLRDITESRLLRLSLNDAEERFRSAFESAGHGMALLGLSGRLQAINPMMGQLLGLEPEQAADRELASIVFPGDIKIAYDLLHRLGSGQERHLSVSLRFIGRGGQTLWGQVSAALYRQRVGETATVFMHVRDNTQERLAEQNLRAAKEEADRSSRAKTRFLAAASHDLRQPLQALNMFVSVLAGKESDPQRAAIVHKIEKTAEALTSLLNTLLDISKLDAGLMRCELRDQGLGPLLTRLAEEFHPVAEAKGLDFRCVRTSAMVHADPALVEIVLRNFLGNAVRYTPAGRVLLGVRRRPDGVEVQVADTGVGIPADQTGLIFEDFHQVENPAREKGEGLGLGLAIVKRVGSLLGARITVASRPGQGSIFGLLLPVPRGEDFDPILDFALPHAEPDAAHGLTIMVLDDEPAILDGLTMVLEGWDCEVLAFDSLDSLQEGLDSGGLDAPPDVVVADYRLGDGVTGVDAVARIRDHFDAPVPALLLTGDTAPQRLREADASGLPLLHKPVKPEVLRAAIADLLASGFGLPPASAPYDPA